MNARTVALSVVLFALIFVVISPQTRAADTPGTCVVDGDQCFNTTYTTQGGGRNLVETNASNPTTADDTLIRTAQGRETDGEQGALCKTKASGTFYPTQDMSAIPLCASACCCDATNAGRPAQVKQPAQSCLSGYDYRENPRNEACSTVCQASAAPVKPVCGEGYITSTNAGCTCGTTPTTGADVSANNYCCWDGSIRAGPNYCQARPGGYCAYNTVIPVNSECICGSAKIDKSATTSPLRVCCNGGTLASTPEQCTTAAPAAPSCGDLVRKDPEQCDAQYKYAPDPNDQTKYTWQLIKGDGCNSGYFCTASCTCEKDHLPVPGDGICDSTEAQGSVDCPKRDACLQPYPTPTFTAKLVATQSPARVQLNWTAQQRCTGSLVSYSVYRSTTNPLSPVAGADKSWQNLAKTETGLSDNQLPNSTTIYYVLRTFYQNATGTDSVDTKVLTVYIPSDQCPTASTSYCVSPTKAINCENYFPNATTCSGSNTCAVRQGKAACAPSTNSCEISCNGVLGMFPDPNAKVEIVTQSGKQNVSCGNPVSTCYKDIKSTSVEIYNSCSSIGSCSGYHTRTACTADTCGKGIDSTPSECLWISTDGGQTETQGRCQAKDEKLRRCSDCNSFSSCDKITCEAINESCYYLEQATPIGADIILPEGCYDPAEQVCEMYLKQEDCEGATDAGKFDLNPDTHYIYSTSKNRANLPKCRWVNDACQRDADKDSQTDIFIDQQYTLTKAKELLRDFTNPMTVINALPDRSYPKDFSVRYTTEQELFACFRKSIDLNQCTFEQETDGAISRTFDIGDSGLWNISYYGRDQSKNIELVGSFGFRVDAIPPSINISNASVTSFVYGKDQQGNNVMRARLSLSFNSSEPASCTTQLNVTTSSSTSPVPLTDRGTNEITNVRGQAFTIDYRQLPDGVYKFAVTCVDDAMNVGTNISTIAIDTNADISGVSPQSTIPPLNTYAITLKARTSKKADCRFGPPGTSYSAMTGIFTTIDGMQHNITYTPGSYTYYYQVACRLRDSGAEIYGGQGDEISFSIDRFAPKTSLCNASTADNSVGCDSTPFLNQPAGAQTIKLRCTDYPLPPSNSFGCDNTKIRSCVQGNGEPICQLRDNVLTYNLKYQDYTRKLPVKLHYQSVDRGGNVEALNTVEISLVDKTAPQVTFQID